MGWIKPLLNIINVGYQYNGSEKTPMNAAVSYHIKNALIEEQDDFCIDFKKGIFSKGILVTSFIKEFSSLIDSILYIGWENAQETIFSDDTDQATFIIYNPAKEAFVTFTAAAKRAEKEVLLQMPANFAGDEVHGYFFYVSTAGTEVSTSVYLGKVKIAK